MKSAESFSAPEFVETEHFDDFGAMDVALRGLERVLADRAEPEASEEGDEDDYENNGDWEDDYDDYEYEYDPGEERLEELEREKQFEVLTIPQEILEEYKLPEDLPAGVAVMGGTARSLARRVVTGDKEPVRDLDLVYIPEFADQKKPVEREELDRIAEKYMPDDYAYGHGIQREQLENYFGTRDFTINQCLVVGNKLLMTRAAYDDFQENIIRPSYYERPREHSYTSNRIFMKALLLQAVLRGCTDSYPMIEDLVGGRYDTTDDEESPVGAFDVALVLNKAMSREVRTARYLTEGLADFDIVNEKYIDQPLLLAKTIIDSKETRFVFRPVDEEIEDGEKWDKDFDIEVASPINTEVRRNLREYRSSGTEYWSEPLSGKYTKADYDKVNGVA